MLFCFVLFCIVLFCFVETRARPRTRDGQIIISPTIFPVTATRGNRQSFDTNARRDTISCISDKKRNLHVQIRGFRLEK